MDLQKLFWWKCLCSLFRISVTHSFVLLNGNDSFQLQQICFLLVNKWARSSASTTLKEWNLDPCGQVLHNNTISWEKISSLHCWQWLSVGSCPRILLLCINCLWGCVYFFIPRRFGLRCYMGICQNMLKFTDHIQKWIVKHNLYSSVSLSLEIHLVAVLTAFFV